MSFERKKIQTETLSEYLAGVRQNLNLSLNEVSSQTGIQPKFLAALESGDFAVLPADVYVLGFLAQLARMYSVNSEELIEQYKKEKGIHKNLVKQGFASKILPRQIFGKVVITPKILSLAVGVAFVVMTVSYIVWQVWSINRAPSLKIESPENFSIIAGAAVEITGLTEPGMSVAINGQNVFVDSEGRFKTQLGLAPGPKEISVVAKNRFGKSVGKVITVTATSQAEIVKAGLELRVNFTDSVEFSFTIDDESMQTINFSAGDSKIFAGREKIVLSTSNAGATVVNLNGENLGPLGSVGEMLNNIPFLASFHSGN